MAKKRDQEKSPPEEEKKRTKLNITRPADTNHLNAIIYGASNAGKTFLLGTASACPEMSPALYLDFENGTRTLAGVDIDVIRPQSWTEIQEIYQYLLHENNGKYKSVLLDSLTEIQKKFSLGTIMGELTDDASEYVDLGEVAVPDRKDWNKTGNQMRKVIRSFRDLAYLPDKDSRVHVVFSALESYREKKDLMCPSLIGALSEDCGAMVDFLFRLSRQVSDQPEEEELENAVARRHLLTDDHISEDGIQYLGKHRGSVMPKSIWNPTMQKIIDAINGTEEV